MSSATPALRVAVVGAGIAGLSCARSLADAGHAVQLFDKARGVGGRLASRRVEWVDADGAQRSVVFDHGAPGFSARSPTFRRFVDQAHARGELVRWSPAMAPGSAEPLDGLSAWVPVPNMPSLCQGLLGSLPIALGCAVDALDRDAHGWRLECLGEAVGEGFDQVVVAMPPRQASHLLQGHRADWAERAARIPMLPCWTLMGVADAPVERGAAASGASAAPTWDMAWPRGPLASVIRNESRPGRLSVPGEAHWVAHASAPWSQVHLEAPAADVQAMLQAALADCLGHPLHWRHALVQRWRDAAVPRSVAHAPGRCHWDTTLGLGVCGDFLGGAGAEGAWLSAQALAGAMLAP